MGLLVTNLSLGEVGKLTAVPGSSMKSNRTNGWKDGPLGQLGILALNDCNVGLQGCWWVPMHQGGEWCVSHDAQTSSFIYEKHSGFPNNYRMGYFKLGKVMKGTPRCDFLRSFMDGINFHFYRQKLPGIPDQSKWPANIC